MSSRPDAPGLTSPILLCIFLAACTSGCPKDPASPEGRPAEPEGSGSSAHTRTSRSRGYPEPPDVDSVSHCRVAEWSRANADRGYQIHDFVEEENGLFVGRGHALRLNDGRKPVAFGRIGEDLDTIDARGNLVGESTSPTGEHVRTVPHYDASERLVRIELITKKGRSTKRVVMNQYALEKLRTLRRIDGGLSIFRNTNLVDLRALAALEEVGGVFSIRMNWDGQFVALAGLESLTTVGGLVLEYNSGLRDISALAKLETIHGDVRIRENEDLPQAQIDALLPRVEVTGTVTIEGNGP